MCKALYKLAIFIPTYKNPNYIKELLLLEADVYQELNILLYIADSSPDNETEQIVSYYSQQYSILHYMRFPEDVPSNTKVYQIYQRVVQEVSCNYVWVRSDALRYNKNFIRKLLCKFLHLHWDILVLNSLGFQDRGIHIIKNRQTLFENYAWIMTLYGATILNVYTIVSGIDWENMERKYLLPDRINYSHTCLYFDRILQLESFHALAMDLPMAMVWTNPKKTRSIWYRCYFHMLFQIWPTAIHSLPDDYNNKEDVIKSLFKQTSYFSISSLETLIADHVLTPDVYDKYRDKIRAYVDLPDKIFQKLLSGDGLGEEEKILYLPEYNLLMNFARQYKRLVIYGAGEKAARYATFLTTAHLRFEAFLVSSTHDTFSPNMYLGHPVIDVSGYEFPPDVGIILGLNQKNQNEVMNIMKQNGIVERTFAFPYSPLSLLQLEYDLASGQAGNII